MAAGPWHDLGEILGADRIQLRDGLIHKYGPLYQSAEEEVIEEETEVSTETELVVETRPNGLKDYEDNDINLAWHWTG